MLFLFSSQFISVPERTYDYLYVRFFFFFIMYVLSFFFNSLLANPPVSFIASNSRFPMPLCATPSRSAPPFVRAFFFLFHAHVRAFFFNSLLANPPVSFIASNSRFPWHAVLCHATQVSAAFFVCSVIRLYEFHTFIYFFHLSMTTVIVDPQPFFYISKYK